MSPVIHHVTKNDLLLEFDTGSIEPDILVRKAIRHFRFDTVPVSTTEPRVLSSRDFVDDWLTHNWRQASQWSDPSHREALAVEHRKHGKNPFASFIGKTMICAANPEREQVAIRFIESSSPTYFIVRHRPYFHFIMMSTGTKPSPGCTKASTIDEENKTLLNSANSSHPK